MAEIALHPCLSCGACCSFFRVSFHWTETYPESHGVPLEMTNQISPTVNAMNGTGGAAPRCVALSGVIGQSARCGIYQNRPGICRAFSASFEDGTRNIDCDRARLSKGLLVLTTESWIVEVSDEREYAWRQRLWPLNRT